MALGQHRFGPVEVQAVSPTVDDDSSAGFDVGTIWINVATDEIFLAADVSVGVAIWVGPVGGGTGGHTIRDDGVDQPARTGLNFIGPVLVVTDDAGGDEQEISIDQSQISHVSIADVTPDDHHVAFVQADADLLYEALGDIAVHAALVDVHQARLHDHSVTEDGTALVPESLDITGGPLALSGDITPPTITSAQDNYDPIGLADAVVLRLRSDGARTLSGLAGGADGRVILLLNVGTFSFRLLHGGAGSAGPNRFMLPDAESMTIMPNEGIKLLYDSTTSRWRVVERGGAPAGVNYLVGTADVRLHSEIVVGLTPGGELGGTWGAPTVDATHSGSTHHASFLQADADLLYEALGDIAVHAALGDVHHAESHDLASHPSLDHDVLSGLFDDDHSVYALLAGRGGGQVLIGGTAETDTLTLQGTSDEVNGFMRIEDTAQIFGSAVDTVQFLNTSAISFIDAASRSFVDFTLSGMALLPDNIDMSLLIGPSDDSIDGSGVFVRGKMVQAADAELSGPATYTFTGFSTIIYHGFAAWLTMDYDTTQSVLTNFAHIFSKALWRNTGDVDMPGFIAGYRSVPGFTIDGGTVAVDRILGYWSAPVIEQTAAPTSLTVDQITAYTSWRGIAFGANPLRTGTVDILRHYHASNPTLDPAGQELAHADATLTTQYGFDVDDMSQGATRIGYRSTMTAGTDKWNMQMGTAQSYHVGKMAFGAVAIPLDAVDIIAGNLLLRGGSGGTGYIWLGEFNGAGDAPAPSDNSARLYVRDNGSGKEQLVVRFATGAVQVLASEP